ncbi:SAM dependent carboxyl methyltransferase [Corchorus olitorius]|uniref:SAM dependent carboxyl methyltransferase n=1 Tax=Corchorus olitorius TaxID=93759 RepID=A0A1R3I0S3_9ROSI|nr:SAM dependent carboxyl methyltransferase [Corchorus olitorius]
MVLIFNGRQSKDPVDKDAYYFWEVLAEASSYLVSQGLIDEEKLHSLNVPYYNPSLNEIQHLIDEEDSLTTEFMDTIALEIGGQSFWPSPELRMKNFRSFSEPIVSNQFGEEVMDKLYNKATQILADDMKQGKDATKHIAIVTVLKKKEII